MQTMQLVDLLHAKAVLSHMSAWGSATSMLGIIVASAVSDTELSDTELLSTCERRLARFN